VPLLTGKARVRVQYLVHGREVSAKTVTVKVHVHQDSDTHARRVAEAFAAQVSEPPDRFTGVEVRATVLS
jgi:hypothetical protein